MAGRVATSNRGPSAAKPGALLARRTRGSGPAEGWGVRGGSGVARAARAGRGRGRSLPATGRGPALLCGPWDTVFLLPPSSCRTARPCLGFGVRPRDFPALLSEVPPHVASFQRWAPDLKCHDPAQVCWDGFLPSQAPDCQAVFRKPPCSFPLGCGTLLPSNA